MVSNRRVLFLYKLEINRIERIYWFKCEVVSFHSLEVVAEPKSNKTMQYLTLE